jgi:orotate phosphoribosyltransferase
MLSAEQFTTMFLQSLHGGGLPGFRRTCRSADLLVIDDVVTTGSTLAACGRELAAGGADAVYVAAIAKADRMADDASHHGA